MRGIEDIELLQPATLAEALRLQADEKTRGVPVAGGTDLMVQWESTVRPVPARAINIKSLKELAGIRDAENFVEIGSAVTHAEMRASPLLAKHLPALAAAAATIGGMQIQAMGTIGGSLANASPAGDLTPPLLVAGGYVVVASATGERTIDLSNFFLGYRKTDLHPDELIVRFVLNRLPVGQREGFRKLGPRASQAISKVMGSYRGWVDGGIVKEFRVALGSVAPTALLLTGVEEWIAGKTISDTTLDELERRAADAVQPIADIRSTTEYRKWVSGRLVRGFLEELTGLNVEH
ncbi:MAG: FAD binding domain-containing protein [bacterium]